jgi:hypothetical protein
VTMSTDTSDDVIKIIRFIDTRKLDTQPSPIVNPRYSADLEQPLSGPGWHPSRPPKRNLAYSWRVTLTGGGLERIEWHRGPPALSPLLCPNTPGIRRNKSHFDFHHWPLFVRMLFLGPTGRSVGRYQGSELRFIFQIERLDTFT